MKLFYCAFILFLISCSGNQTKQAAIPLIIDSTWQKKTITSVLSISLPDSSTYRKEGVLNAYYGEGKTGVYGLDYFDTMVVHVENSKDFLSALKGYVTGKFNDEGFKSYDLLITDTTIGNSTGFGITGYSNDSLSTCKYPFCYLTMANDKFCWFYACQNTPAITNETRQFFSSIQFKKEAMNEADFELPPTRIVKHPK